MCFRPPRRRHGTLTVIPHTYLTLTSHSSPGPRVANGAGPLPRALRWSGTGHVERGQWAGSRRVAEEHAATFVVHGIMKCRYLEAVASLRSDSCAAESVTTRTTGSTSRERSSLAGALQRAPARLARFGSFSLVSNAV